MSIYLKSLSGEITTISLNLYRHETYNIWDTWNRIASIIASENDCLDFQVIIFDDTFEWFKYSKENYCG